jgi:hypothetical protein
MKRTLLMGAGFALVLALLSGFSLIELSVQTARVRWDSFALSSSPVTKGSPLSGKFCSSSTQDKAVGTGNAIWRMGGIECTSSTAGAVGGPNDLRVQVVHEDGGEDCSCSLGDAGCVAPWSLSCHCTNGITELTNRPSGLSDSCYQVQFTTDAGCGTMPGTIQCSVDLFR